MVFAIDVVLRRRVHVKLDELELGTCDAGGAVDDDFDCSPEVFEFDFLFWDVKDGLVGRYRHGVV